MPSASTFSCWDFASRSHDTRTRRDASSPTKTCSCARGGSGVDGDFVCAFWWLIFLLLLIHRTIVCTLPGVICICPSVYLLSPYCSVDFGY